MKTLILLLLAIEKAIEEGGQACDITKKKRETSTVS
jgi:hypothetical protein